MSLAAKLPFRHRHAAGFPGLGSQAVPTDADALDYLDRMAAADGASVEVGVATAVDAFVADAKELGVFSALKACCILAGARTLAGALVPVVGDAPTNVADGFVEGDFSRTAGLTGDGTSYIDSGRANDDGPQNDRHLSVYVSSASTQGRAFAGSTDRSVPPTRALLLYWSSNQISADVQSSTSAQAAYTGGETFIGASRSSSASQSLRINNASQTDEFSSLGTYSRNEFVFARNDSDSTFEISDATIAFYSFGTSLSLEDLDTAVTNLINRLKFALLVGENPSGLDPDTIDYIVRGYEAGGSLE